MAPFSFSQISINFKIYSSVGVEPSRKYISSCFTPAFVKRLPSYAFLFKRITKFTPNYLNIGM
jgi:hypothetical protein